MRRSLPASTAMTQASEMEPAAFVGPVHREVVGDREALEADAAAQDGRHEIGRERGGQAVARDEGKAEMAAHDGGDALGREDAVGQELAVPERLLVDADHGKHAVRVVLGVAVAREVLGGGDDPRVGEAADEGRAEGRDGHADRRRRRAAR